MDGNAFASQMLTALSDERLAGCTTASKCKAALRCAAMGMLPTLKHCALIPRKNRQTGKLEVHVQEQWQGLKAVMERNPDILCVTPFVLHKSDVVELESRDDDIIVKSVQYNPFDTGRTFKSLNDILGAYVKIEFVDGRPPKYHFMNRDEIAKRKKCAQTSEVWDAYPYEMARKTVLINAFNRRVVRFDPLVEHQMTEIAKNFDDEHGNDPMRVAIPKANVSSLEELKQTMAAPVIEEDIVEEIIEEEIEQRPLPDVTFEESLNLLKIQLLNAKTLKDCDALDKQFSDQWQSPEEQEHITVAVEARKDEIRSTRKEGKGADLFDRGHDTPF